ncbi:MAG: GGDEF domain-containing protein [Rhodoferax sp.]
MTPTELAIWSCMAGGLLTICLASLAETVLSRSLEAFLALSFVAALSLYAVLMSGLAHTVLPGIPATALHVLKVSLGPLGSAMALVYLGRWLGHRAEDEWIMRTVLWGSAAMSLTTVALGGLALLAEPAQMFGLYVTSALACFATIAASVFCAWRAHMLGDPLAIWIGPAAVALGITAAGMFAINLWPGVMTLGAKALTGAGMVAYLLLVTTLAIVRTREAKRLQRLAGLKLGADPATGLPTGAALLSKVDDAFWRAARTGNACNVVCLHLHNLYELSDVAGHGVEQQIAIAMSARIRRAVGFRCLVGLYHARCFVAVIQVARPSTPVQIQHFVSRLRHIISKPVHVLGYGQQYHEFRPRWGLSVASTDPENQDPNDVLRQAEEEAMHSGSGRIRAAAARPGP